MQSDKAQNEINRRKRLFVMENGKADLIARIIRVITVPPVLVTVFLLVLHRTDPEVFLVPGSLSVTIAGLGLFPVLAYAVWAVIPGFRKRGRVMQRRLAFVFSLIGYVGTFVYGRAAFVSRELKLIHMCYLLSAVILAVLNYIFKIKASGHACSVTGPLALSIYFIGWAALGPCLVIEAASFWASLRTRRHTSMQLISGILTALASFGACVWLSGLHI